MAHITWQHPEPAPNVFEAVAGDLSEYSVHLCEARTHQDEEADILLGVLRPAVEAARGVTREEARFVLCDFDPVYSSLTIVVTDGDRAKEEPEVFKLIFHDWDDAMQKIPEAAFDTRCREMKSRMYSLLDSVLRSAGLTGSVQTLKEQGFEFWFADGNPEGEWEHLDV